MPPRLTAALLATTMIAACGSSAPTGLSSHPTSSTLAFSQCMRANGVPNFPDLGHNGMPIQASGESVSVDGVSVNAPAFAAARQKCQGHLPTGTVASGPQRAHALRRTLDFSRCMRSHGVANFPDPKVSTAANGNSVVDLRGAGLDFNSPAFKAAAKACGGGPKGP